MPPHLIKKMPQLWTRHCICFHKNQWNLSSGLSTVFKLESMHVVNPFIYENLWNLSQVRQQCSSCESMCTWDSQPYIKSTPTGNILLTYALKDLLVCNHRRCLPPFTIHFFLCTFSLTPYMHAVTSQILKSEGAMLPLSEKWGGIRPPCPHSPTPLCGMLIPTFLSVLT